LYLFLSGNVDIITASHEARRRALRIVLQVPTVTAGTLH
jgi:hypothetical protein